MAVVAPLFEGTTPATSRPWTSRPDWISRPVALPRRCVLRPRPLRTTRPRLHVLTRVRSRPGHTRARWWSTRDPGPSLPTGRSWSRTRSPIPPTPHHLEAGVRAVPQGCSPHRSNKLCPPRGWPTLLPRSRWHRLCTLPPRSRRHTAPWASHGNCTSSHLSHQGGAKPTPPYRHGGIDLLHPLIILLVQDLYAPCHLEACLL